MNDGSAAGSIEQLEFLTKLQRILNEGLFTASYKYALIQALAELSVEKAIASDGTLHIELDELASRFIALYWRQAAPFKSRTVLAQNSRNQATAITKIVAFREYAVTLAQARRHRKWPQLVRQVARLLVQMPLWKLQTVGPDRLDFLYEERMLNEGIVLRPGIAQCFRQQYAVVQALVQMAWLSFVQKLPQNRALLGSTGDLAEFLFGADRTSLANIVDGLRNIQDERCFYCRGPLRERVEVDHFIPWAQYGRDLGHNFVLAHGSCNHDKRDMLAAPVHLERWFRRNMDDGSTLRDIFDRARFMHDLDASLSVAEWSYERAERAGSLVWAQRGETVRLSGEWRHLFAT